MKIVKSDVPGQFFVFTVNYKKRFKNRCYCDVIEQMLGARTRFILAITRINLDSEDVIAYNVLYSSRSTIY